MSNLQVILAGFFSGLLGAMGLGGGSVLIIYLVLVLNTQQLTAQGMNLMFFVPCAITALILHAKNKLIKWKYVLIIDSLGLAGIVAASFFLNKLNTDINRKIFGIFLFIIAIKELFSLFKSKKDSAR